MNEQILQEAGLTNSEATLYLTLIKNSPSAPPYLAQLTNESRTNIYKLLDSLLAKGLVTRDETQKNYAIGQITRQHFSISLSIVAPKPKLPNSDYKARYRAL